MELAKKGNSANLGGFKRLDVKLRWTSAVDLDLMAFYRTKDGRVGGVFSDNYAGGGLGSVSQFPYMQLSGDAGYGGSGGDNEEHMQITKLDEFAEVYVVAVNFTDAVGTGSSSFARYDASVEIRTDKGEVHTIRLDANAVGSVAVLAKFDVNFMGAQVHNASETMSFSAFQASVPGADRLKLLSKIKLANKGDSHTIQLKKKTSSDEILINLNWTTSADLDLGCFYELDSSGTGFFGKMFGGGKSVIDGLQFSHNGGPRHRKTRQGCYTEAPWVWHQGDDRTGSQAKQGEFLLINPEGFADLRRIDVYAFIYEGVIDWAQTDAVVTVKVPGSPDVIVEMGRQSSRNTFAVIASLEFPSADTVKVTKRVTFHGGHADADRAYRWGMRWSAGSK